MSTLLALILAVREQSASSQPEASEPRYASEAPARCLYYCIIAAAPALWLVAGSPWGQ